MPKVEFARGIGKGKVTAKTARVKTKIGRELTDSEKDFLIKHGVKREQLELFRAFDL